MSNSKNVKTRRISQKSNSESRK